MTTAHQVDHQGYRLETILANLRGEFARRGLSESAAAAVCGMSQTALSRRLNDVAPLTVAELLNFCNRLDVPLADLTRPVPTQRVGAPVTGEYQSGLTVLQFPQRHRETVEYDRLAPVIRLADRRALRAVAA